MSDKKESLIPENFEPKGVTHLIRVNCQWCGFFNQGEIPIPSKGNKAVIWCQNCDKAILEIVQATILSDSKNE